jgi:hypothetical protein
MNDYRIFLRFFVYHYKSVPYFWCTFSKSVAEEQIENFSCFLSCFFFYFEKILSRNLFFSKKIFLSRQRSLVQILNLAAVPILASDRSPDAKVKLDYLVTPSL